jgi:membrane protein YdbS with pleckstrin-like domain
MSFTNAQVAPETLPQFADVEYRALHASYAPVLLGVALGFLIPALLIWNVLLIVFVVPQGALVAALYFATGLLLFTLLGWLAWKSARVTRYALREHDVIVQSGIFWRKETIQPIRRIQHIEQHQGPIDKRYGLYELKLFSAGTGHFTFRIPGLDARAASSIRQYILNVQEDGWDADEAPKALAAEAPGGPDD